MIPTTLKQRIAAELTTKSPALVLLIDGIDQPIGSAILKKLIRIGDPDLRVDGSWRVGGSREIPNQSAVLSLDGSTQSIRQQLEIDKGRGQSIQSMEIELIDINAAMTELITPGFVVDDLMARKCRVMLTLDNASAQYPADYITLFRGIIDEIKANPASITLNISHAEKKKKQILYPKVDLKLAAAIDGSQTTIAFEDVTGLLVPVLGPDGLYDPAFEAFVRIGAELIRYTGVNTGANTITGCSRGLLVTIAQAHAIDAEASSCARLQDTAMDLALKMMASGSGYFATRKASRFGKLPDGTLNPRAIYFQQTDLQEDLGITVGDYLTVIGATNGANNVTLRQIASITTLESGAYVEVAGPDLVLELDASVDVSFRSRYDTLPQGLGMSPEEIDVDQHEYVKRLYLSSFNYDFLIKETIEDMKEWIDKELYLPSSSYSLPRKAKASVQMQIGPLPTADLKILTQENIIGPSKLKIRRSINKNFFNTIVYKFEESRLTEDKFLRGRIHQSGDSIARIKIGSRALVITSKGMREALNAQNLALQAADRRLKRYQFGAESIDGVQVTFGIGYDIEVGDIVVFDPEGMHLADTIGGTRTKPAAFFEVQNKSLNYRKGEVSLDLVDTNFNENGRYALIGHASKVKGGIDQRNFVIAPSYNTSKYGNNEFMKWNRFTRPAVKVRSENGTTRFAQAKIDSFNGNQITLDRDLGFIPQAGDIMELADYDFDGVTEQIKLIYAHMKNTNFADGKSQYIMI